MQQLWQELDARDQELFRRGLHIGRVINEYRGDFQRGDFLVRNVLGLDRQTGALAVTDRVRVGQTVQFHVRDAATADEDLHALLQLDLHAHEERPQGALLFTCNGRGTRRVTRREQAIQCEDCLMALHLRHFAITTSKGALFAKISGPHPTREAAHAALTAELSLGGEYTSAGTFAADFEATPIPAPAVKADSKEAS